MTLTSDSVYTDEFYYTDIICPPSGCTFRGCAGRAFSKGTWLSNGDTLQLITVISDSTYAAAIDTCPNSLYFRDVFRYFFRNDSLVLRSGSTGELAFGRK